METTRRGNKQTKQAACVPMTKVNKQTRGSMCGAQMQGVIQCCTICRVHYATCQSTWRGFGDIQRSVEFNVQGHTLTNRFCKCSILVLVQYIFDLNPRSNVDKFGSAELITHHHQGVLRDSSFDLQSSCGTPSAGCNSFSLKV